MGGWNIGEGQVGNPKWLLLFDLLPDYSDLKFEIMKPIFDTGIFVPLIL